MTDYKGNSNLPGQKRLRGFGTVALLGFMEGGRVALSEYTAWCCVAYVDVCRSTVIAR
jgi:hypothetical protein